jgi:hypothetical protein
LCLEAAAAARPARFLPRPTAQHARQSLYLRLPTCPLFSYFFLLSFLILTFLRNVAIKQAMFQMVEPALHSVVFYLLYYPSGS